MPRRAAVLAGRPGQGTFVIRARVSAAQQRELVRSIAARTVRDAHRYGTDIEDVVAEIRAQARPEKRARA